jgi:hypothetical protein
VLFLLPLVFSLEACQTLLNLFFAEGRLAFGTLVQLINDLIVDKIFREIDPVKQKRKIVDEFEIFVPTFVTDKKILDRIHSAVLRTTHDPFKSFTLQRKNK